MDKPELTLNFLKVLIWPVLTVIVLFSFHAEIGSLLGGEVEAEIFGVKLKGKKISGVDQLEQQAKQLKEALSAAANKLSEQDATNLKLREENAGLRKAIEEQNQKIENANASGVMTTFTPVPLVVQETKELAAKSQRLTTGIQADIDRAQSIVRGKNIDQAREHELKGFEYILSDQFDDAIRSFDSSYTAYPDYHNVDEIRKLLRRNKKQLEDPATRDRTKKEIYSQILSRYKWGMPESAEKEMRKYLGS
ncbi:MAG: hypothetical protein ABII06_11555 [Pseudomonadota bacterium]